MGNKQGLKKRNLEGLVTTLTKDGHLDMACVAALGVGRFKSQIIPWAFSSGFNIKPETLSKIINSETNPDDVKGNINICGRQAGSRHSVCLLTRKKKKACVTICKEEGGYVNSKGKTVQSDGESGFIWTYIKEKKAVIVGHYMKGMNPEVSQAYIIEVAEVIENLLNLKDYRIEIEKIEKSMIEPSSAQ